MSDRGADICDVARWRVDCYEVAQSTTASWQEIVAVKNTAIEGESAVRTSARRRRRRCDMGVGTGGRVVGAVFSRYRRAVKNAAATDCQAATFGERDAAGAN